MKIVLQRVSQAQVTVDDKVVGSIQYGMVLLVGFGRGDTSECIQPMVDKIVKMRIFANEGKSFDKDITEVGGEALAISQFTLFADTAKGRRPEFFQALEPAAASQLFDEFVAALRRSSIKKVETGVFGAHMKVSLINDGPVTINLER
jgi:D-tyrosyl-tRNA(Tyr) deacylase